MNDSNCLVEEAAEIEDAGGMLRTVIEVFFLGVMTCEALFCGSVDSADKKRLTCFLYRC
jgi:hypothetical protein